jgi:hypothetical protein
LVCHSSGDARAELGCLCLWLGRRAFIRVAGVCAVGSPKSPDAAAAVLGTLKTVSVIASAVPVNGDVNPYGIFGLVFDPRHGVF